MNASLWKPASTRYGSRENVLIAGRIGISRTAGKRNKLDECSLLLAG